MLPGAVDESGDPTDLGHQHDEKQEVPSEAVEQIHFPHRCWPNN